MRIGIVWDVQVIAAMLSVVETPWFENDDERNPQTRLARKLAISMQVAWCKGRG
jgi:hypothetical protein